MPPKICTSDQKVGPRCTGKLVERPTLSEKMPMKPYMVRIRPVATMITAAMKVTAKLRPLAPLSSYSCVWSRIVVPPTRRREFGPLRLAEYAAADLTQLQG